MKIQLASDLHLEFLQRDMPGERLIAPMPGAEVLVLAGDIANGAHACKLFADWRSTRRIPIVYVAGNHEYYGHALEPMLAKIREGAALNNIHFLENNSVVIDGVRFLGATMWTDYKLCAERTQQQSMAYAGARLNDHYLIRKGRHLFRPQDALERHLASIAWLQTELDKPFDGKTVLVTHHGLHMRSVNPRFAASDLNAAFNSHLPKILDQVDLHLHGHVHDGVDYQLGRCRVVANPAGYLRNHQYADRQDFAFENETFDKSMVLELPT
ncbi:MAG: metallophosphoesterase [Rhodoferax sp.]